MSNHDTTPLAHSIADACKRIGLSRSTIYEMLSTRQLRSFKIGHRTLIPETELQRIVSERMAAAV